MLRARSFADFDAIIAFDFEFGAPPGERPTPRCVVAHDLVSGRRWRVWLDGERVACPYPVGPRVLFIAYYASAEVGCHLVLGWPLPENVLDLCVEFKNLRNIFSSTVTPGRAGLIDALRAFRLESIADEEKASMRALALRGGPYSADEISALLNYCESDVDGTGRLFRAMEATVDAQRALLRGAFMVSAAKIEHTGIPVDAPALAVMREHWDGIRMGIIRRGDADYGIYDDGGHFKLDRFTRYLDERGFLTTWPRTATGTLALDDGTFRGMANANPELQQLRELRATLGTLRLGELAVGKDERNRVLLSAFGARTSRNAPSTTAGIFGAAKFLRRLIRPRPGMVLAYIDYRAQEFGVAAALSGDEAMMQAYSSGDCYLAFAKQVGRAPPEATKATHEKIRDQFKECVLGTQYAMGASTLASRVGEPIEAARQLLQLHREAYPRFWRWSDATLETAMLEGALNTVFGWRVSVREDARPTSLRNFAMQSNGAEMLRLACLLAHDEGVSICMPIHDALLIEAPEEFADAVIATTIRAMEDASAVVLGGFRLTAQKEHVIRYPGRYEDSRGAKMWTDVWDAIAEVRGER